MTERYDQPSDLIDHCLRPLSLDHESAAFEEACMRLSHVLETYQRRLTDAGQPIDVDFARTAETV